MASPAESVPRPPELASLWSRVGAYVIDSVLQNIATFAVGFGAGFLVALAGFLVAGDFVSRREEDNVRVAAIVVGIVASVLVAGAYNIIGNASGGTIGKRLIGLRVVSATQQQPIGLSKALLRWLVQIIGFIPTLFLGWLWAIWDPRNQTWHDKAAGSLVINAVGNTAGERTLYKNRWVLGISGGIVSLAVASIIILVIVVRSRHITIESNHTALTAHVGDCVSMGVVPTIVNCSQVHDGTVIGISYMPDGPFPGLQQIDLYANTQCPAGSTTYLYPTAPSWALGDRQIACVKE